MQLLTILISSESATLKLNLTLLKKMIKEIKINNVIDCKI